MRITALAAHLHVAARPSPHRTGGFGTGLNMAWAVAVANQPNRKEEVLWLMPPPGRLSPSIFSFLVLPVPAKESQFRLGSCGILSRGLDGQAQAGPAPTLG